MHAKMSRLNLSLTPHKERKKEKSLIVESLQESPFLHQCLHAAFITCYSTVAATMCAKHASTIVQMKVNVLSQR